VFRARWRLSGHETGKATVLLQLTYPSSARLAVPVLIHSG
jgi:hypothetical protein